MRRKATATIVHGSSERSSWLEIGPLIFLPSSLFIEAAIVERGSKAR